MTPLSRYEDQMRMLEMMESLDLDFVFSEDCTVELLTQFFLCQFQGLRFLQAYCLAQNGELINFTSQTSK